MPVRVARGGRVGPSPRRSAAGSATRSTTAPGSSTSAWRRTGSTSASSAPWSMREDHGVLVFGAAGNSGDTDPLYPAGYPGVLAVAGTDQNDQLDDWSTRGSWVQLAAPGCEEVLGQDGNPAYGCGSSFGPPAVSGHCRPAAVAQPWADREPDHRRAARDRAPGAGHRRRAGRRVGRGQLPRPRPGDSRRLRRPSPRRRDATPTSSRQVLLTDGVVRRKAVVRLAARGRAALPAADRPVGCGRLLDELSRRGILYVDLPGEKIVRSLAATVKAGNYNVTISCHYLASEAVLARRDGDVPELATRFTLDRRRGAECPAPAAEGEAERRQPMLPPRRRPPDRLDRAQRADEPRESPSGSLRSGSARRASCTCSRGGT